MEIIKIGILCLILMTKCFAVENKTTNSEKLLRIQKREKQYLIEDDECKGPGKKRNERQNTPSKTNQVGPALKRNMMNVRLQPKILAAALKPVILPKNSRTDTTTQRVPAKIPVILKTGKVIPGPAHAIRLKMLENRRNEDTDLNAKEKYKLPSNKEDPLSKHKEDNIPFKIEDKVDFQVEDRPNKENEIISNQGRKVTVNKDDKVKLQNESKVSLDKDSKLPSNKNKHKVLINDENVPSNEDEPVTLHKGKKATINKIKEDKMIAKPIVIVEENYMEENCDDVSDAVQKPNHFFIDEADSVPTSIKKQPKSENRTAKNKEVAPNKTKEISIEKKEKKKPNNVQSEQKEQSSNNQYDDDPEIVHVSNGTHLISIKNDRYKMQHLPTRDKFDEPQQQVEERVVNCPPPDKPNTNPPSETEENAILAVFGDTKHKGESIHKAEVKNYEAKVKKDKDTNECIITTNHDYEECEETTKLPSPVTVQSTNTYNDGTQGSWNYLQTLPNKYCNSYSPNIYDQYKRYYDGDQGNPYIPNQENNYPYYVQKPEPSQVSQALYYPNENQASYNDPYEKQPGLDYTFCPENTLDKIWRAWKDVEIKIRKSQTGDEPIDIDIRRNMVDSDVNVNNGDFIGHIPYTTQPISLNGYYNNQNNELIYPYVNPSYRCAG